MYSFVIQWNLIIKSLDITQPSYKFILLAPALNSPFFLTVMTREFSWSEGPRYDKLLLYIYKPSL